jgi:hypothetical protein
MRVNGRRCIKFQREREEAQTGRDYRLPDEEEDIEEEEFQEEEEVKSPL